MGNRPVVEDVPANDDNRAVVGRRPVFATRGRPITGTVERRTNNAEDQSRESPFLPHRPSSFFRRVMIPFPHSHRDPRSSRTGVLEVERRGSLSRMATRERRFPQRSNRTAVLDRINVSVNGTRSSRRVPNTRSVGDVGMIETPISARIRTPIGGGVMTIRPYAHLTTASSANRLNSILPRALVGRLFSTLNSGVAFPLPPHPRLLARPVAIERRTQRRNIGDDPNEVINRLDTNFSGEDLFEIPHFLLDGEASQVEFFDFLRRVISEEDEEEERLVFPPNQLFNPNVDPFEIPDPLTKTLGNSGEACTICYDDDVADAVYCMHCYQQVGCFGCLIRWVQTNSVEVEPGVRYVSNRDHLSCPLCRHLWETARPEVFRNTERKKEQATRSSQRKRKCT
uniref:RING-type domain-containing protein n=1 Tax=Rhabditophanes sp. KR3021 TaxID=114890 RepID=A0AC35TVT8_9BILA